MNIGIICIFLLTFSIVSGILVSRYALIPEGTMAQHAPGHAYRKGMTIFQVMDMFPTEEAARKWLEVVRWPRGHCLS